MEVIAKLNNLRIAPRKVREVIDLIRNKKSTEALTILSFTTRKSAPIVLKLLNSAIANAKNNFKLDENNLYIAKIFAGEGPKLKRWHPMSRGRAYPIEKKTSHITIVLSDQKVESRREKRKNEKKTKKIINRNKAKINK